MIELTPSLNGTSTTQRLTEPTETKEKAVFIGTHRVCTPEDTLERIRPFLSRMGITRVADLTRLDNLGVPVVQAVRPNSRNLSVSQGKGITKALATVSALMEAIELWHAEEPSLPSIWAQVGEMSNRLPYSIYDLNLNKHHLIHDALPLEWFPARVIGSLVETFVPANYVRVNSTMHDTWLLPTFFTTSNGLASGNVQDEAILHGLYEVIERDTLVRARAGTLQRIFINPASVDGTATAPLLKQFKEADATVEIQGLVGPTGITCFEVHLTSPSYSRVIEGYGCHLDRDVALSRALTEAAQIRLSIIAGSRDDIQHGAYSEIQQMRPLSKVSEQRATSHFHTIPSTGNLDLQADLSEVLKRLRSVVSCPPLFVDLTRAEFNIPVVFVVVPQFRMVEGY